MLTDRPTARVAAWKACPLGRRLGDCLTLLAAAGAMTDGEAHRVRLRLIAWAGVAGDQRPNRKASAK